MDLDARLAHFRQVRMPFDSRRLTPRERSLVGKLVEACQHLELIFWQQSDPEALTLYRNSHDPKLRRLLMINGGRWDFIDEHRPFVGAEAMPPGHTLYPPDLTRTSIESYVKSHPAKQAQIYNPLTVVRRNGSELVGVPYHQVYRTELEKAARALREAAALSADAAFAHFLRLRADALLTGDYYQSDLAWLDLKDPKFDLIFAPYETYLDDLLGVKASYGASILIRDDTESQKVAVFQKYVPQLQDALPLPPADRPSKLGHVTPMEVADTPFRAGDLRHGYQAVADNLPNDPKIHEEKGSKKIFFNNFLFFRLKEVILPISKRLMRPDQAAKVTPDGFMAGTVMHEIAHGLGPAFARMNGKQVDIREAIGPAYSGLEEAKADVVGMFGLKWLVDRNVLQKDRLDEYYASYVGSIFRTLRFGTGEAHGRAEMMEFNYLLENHALLYNGGVYTIDYARIPMVIASLAKELLDIEAKGDRARVETWFAKYDKMPLQLQNALSRTNDIPVDIEPIFSFKDNVR
jgi:hypothetical protein